MIALVTSMNSFLMLTIVCVLLGGASAGSADASGLLPERSLPPAFSLPDRNGHDVKLQTFLHSRRIVLLFNPGAAYLTEFERNHAFCEERDITVIAIVPSGTADARSPYQTPDVVMIDAQAVVAHLYGAPVGLPAFYLIGKDGHIAMARHTFPTLRELFATIDAMPMRRARDVGARRKVMRGRH